jgi:hypothetical protein
MRHSEIDKRAKRYAPKQCLSDYGHNVHKDAPTKEEKEAKREKDRLAIATRRGRTRPRG